MTGRRGGQGPERGGKLTTVVMPMGASAAGEAFELLASRYLCDCVGLKQVATPFYARLERGRWVQFDGLFARRDGSRLVLEAKFYGHPIGLSTPGIAARVTFAKEAGAKGIALASRAGFTPDVLRARLAIEKVLLSWKAIRRALAKRGDLLLTAALDPIIRDRRGYTARSGATLVTTVDIDPGDAEEGFAFLDANIERWLRRLPAATGDIDAMRPPRRLCAGKTLDIISAWTIEDSLRGFAPAAPQLLEKTIRVLRDGPLGMIDAWKALWRLGYRGRVGGLKNALDDLCVMGIAQKYRSERGLFYAPLIDAGGDAAGVLAHGVERWPAAVYFRQFLGCGLDKNALSAEIAERFAPLFPYARSLYNPAKVAGLVALTGYLSDASTTRPS